MTFENILQFDEFEAEVFFWKHCGTTPFNNFTFIIKIFHIFALMFSKSSAADMLYVGMSETSPLYQKEKNYIQL